MAISSKRFHLKSVLACAAMVLLFATAQPHTASALVAAASDDTPGTTTPNKVPTTQKRTYKSGVASQISNAIASEKAKALSKQQVSDKDALAKVDNVGKLLDDARKSGMTDEAIRKEFSVLHPTPVTPTYGTTPISSPTMSKPPIVAEPPVLNPNQKYMLERAKEMGWSEETLKKELAGMGVQ